VPLRSWLRGLGRRGNNLEALRRCRPCRYVTKGGGRKEVSGNCRTRSSRRDIQPSPRRLVGTTSAFTSAEGRPASAPTVVGGFGSSAAGTKVGVAAAERVVWFVVLAAGGRQRNAPSGRGCRNCAAVAAVTVNN